MCRILFVSVILSLSFAARASEPSAADVRSVGAAVESLNAALIGADSRALEALTSPQLSYGHSSGKIQDRAGFVADVASKAFDFVSIRTSEQTITISGGTAIVRHIFSANYVANGAAGELKIGNVLMRQNDAGKWKLLARQAYKL